MLLTTCFTHNQLRYSSKTVSQKNLYILNLCLTFSASVIIQRYGIEIYELFSFITGATVVSWRVNNQEQLFVR